MFPNDPQGLSIDRCVLQPHTFSNPAIVNVSRGPKEQYLTWDGVTPSLGVELTTKIMSQVLRAVFEFDGIRRASGLSGKLKRYKVAEENALRYEYIGADHLPTAWPNMMVLQVSLRLTLRFSGMSHTRWAGIV
jgi:hypothetical protein